MRTREHASPVTTASQTGLTFILILSGLMAFTSLSTDIYLPAMPTMAEDLHGNVELTITGFLIGFTIAQLIWGPISDHMGRRKPLFIGMVLFIIGSAGCALSTSITQIVFWRVFQALGACTGPMLARAMIRDLFARTRAAQMLSTLVLVMAIAPIAGPLIGGQIIRLSTWHSIFWLLVVIGALMFISLNWLPETLPEDKRVKASLAGAFRNYRSLLTNGRFMRYTLNLTFYYVGAYAFITGSPFVYISYYHVDPQHYGWLFALNIIGVMAMSVVNRRLVQRHALEQLLKYATLLAALAAVVLALLVKLESGGVVAIIITVFLFFSMNGIIAATSTAAALDAVPNIAGSASALIGALQYGSGIISSLLLAAFSDGTPWTMAWIIALFTLLSAVLAFRAKR
ncbi:multidrug effflux MFS transporter [Citrobacter portucalensis]|uniref:multidrug effflux MFS transporter n=1 Tax=Citrobacter portucalensis TaxID=1639133 RepID=UPI0018A49D76|nr:multidrug effflux MFS transporter [Citrobacter portucalensis]BBV41064.1 Bcr/CflA family drug resistance efflux transporter [Citrobacter portucalensis]BBV46017.1 Bcr/CflA family drug resistance efflux transporter [Citrobacter portucalensis]BBV51304.1 Bcr/CflA family drug resistance efflux transporter [Citrobacter portucalensis]BBW12062.1 Bcr/CflA family drug resistance efflux transporter [Citrobacter portucalensis]BBW17086.1 Bcr/CflA family drug resistance efflux transporter [Citrobacter por